MASNCIVRFHDSDLPIVDLSSSAATLSLVNCTLVDNRIDHHPTIGAGNTTIANSILRNNAPSELKGSATATYSNVRGGWPGEGNFDADPLFSLSPNLRLMASSPCVGAGTAAVPGGLPSTDIDGNPRVSPAGGAPDVGAYEYQAEASLLELDHNTISIRTPLSINPAVQTIRLRNAGFGEMDWAINTNCDWLTVTPNSGLSTGDVNDVSLTFDTAGLPHGVYECQLLISAAGALNAPQTVSVKLNVNKDLAVPSEFGTIQAAIDAAIDGDTIDIGAGIYTGEGNIRLDLHGKALQLIGRRSQGQVVIDGGGTGPLLNIHTGEPDDVLFQGIEFRNSGDGQPAISLLYPCAPSFKHCRIADNSDGAVRMDALSNATFDECEIAGNTATQGGGLWVDNTSTARLNRCVLRDNFAFEAGGAMRLNHFGLVEMRNCLVLNNHAASGGAGFIEQGYPSLVVTGCTIVGNRSDLLNSGVFDTPYRGYFYFSNCILWDNGPTVFSGGFAAYISVDYCNSEFGTAGLYEVYEWGAHNIDADPNFVDADADDYRLSSDSPCVDAGEPDFTPLAGESDLDDHLRVWNDRIDMGAYELGSYDFADVNCDGEVNNFDIDAFVIALTSAAQYESTYPACEQSLADVNRDGLVNNFDIDPFISLLAN